MFDRTFPSDETRNDLSDPGSPNGMGTFYRAEAPRPDTVALLAELGMPAHAIRTYVPSQAGIGSDR